MIKLLFSEIDVSILHYLVNVISCNIAGTFSGNYIFPRQLLSKNSYIKNEKVFINIINV